MQMELYQLKLYRWMVCRERMDAQERPENKHKNNINHLWRNENYVTVDR